jgi:hypothetical protein
MFGHTKLSALVDEQGYLETTGSGNATRIRLKGKQQARQPAEKKVTEKKVAEKKVAEKKAPRGTARKIPASNG